MSITPVGSKGFTNLNIVKKTCKYFKDHQSDAIAYATLASLVGKDGVGCYMYVTQSLNNKRIPDDKRRFVAAMDFTNGILMMASQVAFFFAARKFTEPVFNKLFKKSFDKGGKVCKDISSQIRQNTKVGKQDVKETYNELRNTTLDTFKKMVDIFAATILAKRVFVPFVSTPLAQYCTRKIDERAAAKAAQNGQNPSMQGKAELPKAEPKAEVSTPEKTNLLDKYKK